MDAVTRPADVAGAFRRARRLADGLDARLRYHDVRHTFVDVLGAARALAADLGVAGRDLELIEVAVAFHDLGFLHGRQQHERAGVALARDVLAAHGFTDEEIDRVAGMILATRLPQRPRTLHDRIVADADMAALAAPDFLARNEDLRLELVAYGRPSRPSAWLAQQRRFVLAHRFHTDAAERRFGPGRARNATLLGARLRRVQGSRVGAPAAV